MTIGTTKRFSVRLSY